MGRGLFMHAGEEKACQTLSPQTEPSVSINITQSSIGIPFKEPFSCAAANEAGRRNKILDPTRQILGVKECEL